MRRGMLMGEIYRHVKGRKIASKRSVLFTVEDGDPDLLQSERRPDRNTLAMQNSGREREHAAS